MGFSGTKLEYLADLGIRTIHMSEHWGEFEGGVTTPYVEELHSLVQACHQNGIQFTLYFGPWLSDLMPEFETYGGQWRMKLGAGRFQDGKFMDLPPLPPQTYYPVCFGSGWQDFLVNGIANMMDEFDIEGIYFDGATGTSWLMVHPCLAHKQPGRIYRSGGGPGGHLCIP